ncbi:MAG: PQQ-binding-like beta-propeller repeat protein, partial [Planctomycetota bacterium]
MRICDVLPTPGFAVNDTLSRRQLVMLTSFLLFVMVSASASGSEPNSSELSSDASFSLPRVNAGASGFIDITLPDELGVIWETKTAEAIETTPVVDQGRVFVADVMGGVEALELQSGKSLWRRDFDTGFVASPTILSASSVTHHPDRLVVLETDKDDATPDGQRRTVDGNQIDKWDRIIASDRLLLGDVEGNVWSLDPATGQTQWQIAIEAEIDAAVAFFVLVADEQPQVQLLVTSQDGNLRCLNAENGELIWTYATGDQIRCGASIAQGKTFLGGCDGGLHIVDLTTGKAVGEPLPLGGPTGSTPATESGPVFV